MTQPAQQSYQQHGSAEDFLMGGGVKSASFDGAPPITWEGTIVEFGKQQKRDFDTNEPVFWSDGRPKEVLRVTLQTNQRDPSDPEDDGQRAVYLEWKKAWAVRDAVKASGAKFEPGGYLSLTYTHDGQLAQGKRGKPPKEFKATYSPPEPSDPWAGVTGQPAPAQQSGWPGPSAQTASIPTTPNAAPATPASAVTPGVDPRVVALSQRGIDTSRLTEAQIEMLYKTL
ncbi:hypothetical protein OV450_3384 [Actinobacteria bacterium OV450]|nr:hypothetical protein OV450_3384 [Actinobacteria bacterium OV450]